MTDITLCQDKKCPSRTMCYRFQATPSEYQSYALFDRKKGKLRCRDFWDMSEICGMLKDGKPQFVSKKVRKWECTLAVSDLRVNRVKSETGSNESM